MKLTKRFLALCVALLYCMGAVDGVMAQRIPGIGVVYFVYDLGTYNPNAPTSSTNNWYLPGDNFKTPVGLYNLNTTLVDQQIANMRASGMDYVTLHIAMKDLSACMADGSCNDGYSDWVWGELVDDSQSALRPQQEQNLVSILQDIKKQGFRHVIVRFGNYDPTSWSSWQEAEYQKAWNFIVNARNVIYTQLQGSVTTPIFDLQVEATGDTQGQVQAYAQRLWIDYTTIYGSNDTVGFSSVGDATHVSASSSLYGTNKPKMYALDIYDNTAEGLDVGQGLLSSAQALGSEASKPIIIMETYDNDATTASELQSALQENPSLNVVALMQWQRTRQTPCSGCDTNITGSAIQALNTTTQMSNYASIASPIALEETNPSLLHFVDVNCAGTDTTVCSMQGQFGYAPPSSSLQTYLIYVANADATPKLWVCYGGSPTTGTATFMQRDVTYRFDYYQVPSCNASVSGMTPVASSYVWIR